MQLIDDNSIRKCAERIRKGVDAESVCRLIRDTYETRLLAIRQEIVALKEADTRLRREHAQPAQVVNADGLLPCPFCGGECEMMIESSDWMVGCKNEDCYATGQSYHSRQEATEWWNRRLTQPAQDGTGRWIWVEDAGKGRIINPFSEEEIDSILGMVDDWDVPAAQEGNT